MRRLLLPVLTLAAQVVFLKDFPHYIMHMIDDDFLAAYTHSFLIRTPEKMLPSMYKHWPDFEIAETGYAEQRDLFNRIADRDGKAPPVTGTDAIRALEIDAAISVSAEKQTAVKIEHY